MVDLRRLGVFNLVGLAGFAVQISLLALLTRVWGWHHVPATAVAMQTVIVQNFLAHSRWTWGDRPARTARERLLRPLRYQGAKALSLGANVALTAFFVTRNGVSPEVANALAVGVCAVLNFLLADRLVFSDAVRVPPAHAVRHHERPSSTSRVSDGRAPAVGACAETRS